jgi:hypothetical protein
MRLTSGCGPAFGLPTGIAASLNHTARLPRWRRAASYSDQFVTRRRCLGMLWRRLALNLSSTTKIPGIVDGDRTEPYWADTIGLPPTETSAPCNSDQRSQDPARVTRAGPSHNPVHEIDPAGLRATTRLDPKIAQGQLPRNQNITPLLSENFTPWQSVIFNDLISLTIFVGMSYAYASWMQSRFIKRGPQMTSPFRKTLYLASTALSLTLASYSAQAYPALPNLPNLNFVDYTGSAPKNLFTVVDPVGWGGGNGLISIDAPGTATKNVQTNGNSYPTWVDPGPVPNAGNYVQADGNPSYESSFSYQLTGLTAGNKYTLSFYQAAGQQSGFSGATTEQWIVSLAADALTVSYAPAGCGNGKCTATYGDLDPNASIAATTLMMTPSEGGTPWQYVSVTLTADATTDLLSFLAWGNGGSTVNEPPTLFLTAVDAPPGLAPEPAALSVLGVGLVGLGGVARRRRKKLSTSN